MRNEFWINEEIIVQLYENQEFWFHVHYAYLQIQEKKMKEKFPEFDLKKALDDKKFLWETRPAMKLICKPVEEAYMEMLERQEKGA